MNFTSIFIKRPVFASVLSLILLLVGIKCYFMLPVRLYPKINVSVINISVSYPGADAELMESSVTNVIENALSGIDGIDYVASGSSQGGANINVIFKLGYDIDAAMADVSAKVNSVKMKLPKEIYDPVISKKDPNANPCMYLAFFSDKFTPEQVTDYIKRVVQPQMQVLPGVAQVEILGEREYAMRVFLDPKLMAAYSVTTTDLYNALTVNNVQSPAGRIQGSYEEMNVKTHTDLSTADQFDNLVLKNTDGHLIRIKDIGTANLGPKSQDFSFVKDEKEIVGIAVSPMPTANPLDVSHEVKKFVQSISGSIPQGMSCEILWDNSIYIEESIREVKKTIIEAIICVIAVVFLFLFSFRVLLIPLVTIPISIVGVFAVMAMMGYTLNTITFLSVVLAIGMVVDDAIVVSENIHRHILLGKNAFDAAVDGAKEIQFAIISMTITLAAVYAPIGFLSGLVGSLFKEFAFTLASAVIISGFVAITLSPMMCSKLMHSICRNKNRGRESSSTEIAETVEIGGDISVTCDPDPSQMDWTEKSHQMFASVARFYRKLLERVLKMRKIVISIVILCFVSIFFLYKFTPAELAPREDTGGILTIVSAPTASGIGYTEKYSKQLFPIYKSIPEAKDYFIVNGLNGVNSAFSVLILKPWSERRRTANEIVKEMFPKTWGIPGVFAFPLIPSMLPGTSSGMPIRLVIQSTGDYAKLYEAVEKMKFAAYANPGLTNIDTDLKMDREQVDISIDRDKIGEMGISVSEIGNAINIALGKPTVGHFYFSARNYDVVPQLEEAFRNTPQALNSLNLRSKEGVMVPLSNLVSMKESLQSNSISHFQQMRSATLSANMQTGYPIGMAIKYLQKMAKEIVPSNMQTSFAGESRQYLLSEGTMEMTFLFALLFIFLVLAAQFESFTDPLIVLFSVPLSVLGALLALKITGSTLNIFSQIGVVTLVGLIAKHGILIVEFANQIKKDGKSALESVVIAAETRLRPVLMTTAAMVLGALPLAFASGAGSVSRKQIGIVIIGGMLIGTMFTMFVVPTIYVLFKREKKNSGG